MQLQQLHGRQLCISGVAMKTIGQQHIVELNGILGRQEHDQFALTVFKLFAIK